MAGYCLEQGRLRSPHQEETAGRTPAAIFHLDAEGNIRPEETIPELFDGEGLLLYEGQLYVEPLEIQVEFLKAEDEEQWLKALLLRHVERVRQVDPDLWVLAEIQEVNP